MPLGINKIVTEMGLYGKELTLDILEIGDEVMIMKVDIIARSEHKV